MQFASWNILYLLWLTPLIFVILFFAQKRYQKRLTAFGALRLAELVGLNMSRLGVLTKSTLLVLSFIFIILALARPRWGYEWKEVAKGGSDVMVVLDLSTSMLATDINPSRIERAKREVTDLLNILEGDRIGIITFAGIPYVHCPLTSDYRLAQLFISQINTELMPVQGTKIGDATQLAIDTLEKYSKAGSENKAIILITDGEDHETKPLDVAQKAKEKGIKIFSVGIGGEDGAPIPLPSGGFKKDASGQLIVSKLGEETLKQMALTTGGIYIRSTSGDMDLDHVYRQGIRQTDGKTYGSDRQKIWQERYQWFVLVAFFLLLLEFFIKNFKKAGPKTLLFLLACFLFSSFNPESFADPMKEAEKAYAEKNYEKASEKFTEAEVNEPNVANHAYNRSVSQFRANNFDQALQGFTQSAQAQDARIRQNAFYNLGNTLVAKGELEKSLKAYEEALKLNPQDKEALENKQWVEKQIKKKEEEKQNEQDKKDQDKKNQDQDKQDQKNQDQDQKQKEDKNQDQKNQDQQNDKNDQKSNQQEKKEEKNAADTQKNDEQQKEKKDDNTNAEQDKNQKQAAQQSMQEQINKEEAERLLRNLEEQIETYGLPPKASPQTEKPKYDW